MTTYKFNLKNSSNNNSYSSSNSSYLKSLIANSLADKYSWFNDTPSTTYISTNHYTPTYSDYGKALSILDNYAAKKYNKKYLSFSNYYDEYDFEIDGTPIRIFDDMIQIGNHMIAKNASSNYYNNLSPSLKKIIINITIKISK